MNHFDKNYQSLIKKTLAGTMKPTRSGIDAVMHCSGSIEHEMKDGFPLTTLRKVNINLISSELEFFLKGKTDKRWLQKRNNHIYDEWCNPEIVPYAHGSETLEKMKKEPDLGPINGFQWRNFGGTYAFNKNNNDGIDQIIKLLHTIKTNPNSKRMIVTAWNPVDQPKMAMPPCPFAFGMSIINKNLNLFFFQRSVDLMLGFPFDVAHHAMLLHLFAKETGYKEGKLTGFFGNMEIYKPHIHNAHKLLARKPYHLPRVTTQSTSLLKWKYSDTVLINYKHHPFMKNNIAV